MCLKIVGTYFLDVARTNDAGPRGGAGRCESYLQGGSKCCGEIGEGFLSCDGQCSFGYLSRDESTQLRHKLVL
jgi:hypothetical protein